MSEESINKNEDDLQQEIGEGADNTEIVEEETDDVITPGPRGIANKDKEDIESSDKENFESND